MHFFQPAMTNLAYTPDIREVSTQPQQAHFADATEAEFALKNRFFDLLGHFLRDLRPETVPQFVTIFTDFFQGAQEVQRPPARGFRPWINPGKTTKRDVLTRIPAQ
jgi:hypothetical protein